MDAATGYHVCCPGPPPHPARLPVVGRNNVNAKYRLVGTQGQGDLKLIVESAPLPALGLALWISISICSVQGGAAPRLTFASSFVVFLFTSTAHSYPKESRAAPSEHTHGHTLGVLPRL